MDNATRLQYLTALGIDVWVPRVDAPVDDDWGSLNAEMLACQQCDLCQSRQQVVVGVGNQQADYLWITEAPSMEDDRQGQPFVDASAELFSEMLRAMQLSREQVFITNIVKCRLPEDRDPKQLELVACADFLQRQIALIQPKVLIAVGRIAAHKLLQSKAPLAELRGVEHQFSGIPLIAIYHPAYLLRVLTEKPKAWHDMQIALTLVNKTKNNDKTSIEPA
ncbi:uracil-DNA glycosylase [Bathymodiolus japonicus methanotrophic gill symbiont]|uniref:uracil-DNA glycosylase n=1 Tax=Bathymodiolus japonicus methanotrophic gill symbiont TaxID=113269 RepID=UPI001B6DAABE|nr:uracil-DNA glycosylase [Bathymodiolus japonicus methanotrophic gill symbiont]GFO72119.1 uracil-DNA glycosylase [Bathymodiolus japonicus methanotrophic gill symbiont]